MSNRYSLTLSKETLEERFEVDVPGYYKPVYNAGPTLLLPVITSEHPGGISMFYWGITPELAKNKTVSNRLLHTKAESISEKNYLKKALRKNRCIIPADGFYEWKSSGKKSKIPYRICLNNRMAFSFAGLWEEYESEDGDVHTFHIITTQANSVIADMNDRMPVMLNKAQEDIWLNKDASDGELLAVLKPIASEMIFAYTVSPKINDLNVNDESLIRQAPAADQFGNLTLFD
jgi:putative SOS response-associated peptidase YedK